LSAYIFHLIEKVDSSSSFLRLGPQPFGLFLELFGTLAQLFATLLLLERSFGKLLLLVKGLALVCPFLSSLNIRFAGFLGLGFRQTLLVADLYLNTSLLLLPLKLRF
jgi:hypothetical protein